MKITIEQEEAQLLRRIAKQNGVNEEKLWETYQSVMASNFEQDLYDIAKDYIEQIKQHDKLDYDYDDVKKMYVLEKYDGYHGEWKEVKIYATTQEDMEELIRCLEAKEK